MILRISYEYFSINVFLAPQHNEVHVVDIIKEKVNRINNEVSLIHDDGIKEY